MDTINFSATRVILTSHQSFEQVISALEAELGESNNTAFDQLIEKHPAPEQVSQAIEDMLGPSGFMILAKIDQGRLLSLLGRSKKGTLYVLGNPLLANLMFEFSSAVGLYIPPRLYVYEDNHGVTKLVYDKPSSLLEQFQSEQIAEVARMLDQKLKGLATIAVGGHE